KKGEQLIAAFKAVQGIGDADSSIAEDKVLLATRLGMIKKTRLDEFVTFRSYKTKSAVAMKLKKDDELISAIPVKDKTDYQVVLLTHRSYSLRYPLSEVSSYSLRAQGVIGINLKEEDYGAAALIIEDDTNTQIVG